ncbi:seryl-tRNA synthetase [Pseudoloma neurophilia]|uniref:Seryl-tRNA synthetase n=1 Tax=Pseudoloma neurophilia TaxID=146866 RepID=A0A0R0M0F3_9MICR|nr:seryl-tRNA synthetase [Pseudoloma neurophilia]
MERTFQLNGFDEQLYTFILVCNAIYEQPVLGLYMNERLTDQGLPKRFAGCSLCFRKKARAASKDSHGIFRVHQFEKIKPFIIGKSV